MSAVEALPPTSAGKAAIVIMHIVAFVIIVLFVGFNLHHEGTPKGQHSSQS